PAHPVHCRQAARTGPRPSWLAVLDSRSLLLPPADTAAAAAPPAPSAPASGRWARWVRFLDRRERGTSLALLRIAIGCVVVGAVGSVVLHGLVPSLWFDRAHGGFLARTSPNWLFRLLGGATPAAVWAVTVTALVSGALLAVGIGGRVPALVALQS